jgi:hypothetical protein
VHPSGLSFLKLWNDMRPEQRTLALKHFWSDDPEIDPSKRDSVISAIAKARKSRLSSIKKAAPTDLEKWALAVQGLPSDVLSCLIRSYLLNEHRGMITAFLDGIQIPHVGGVMAADFEPATPSPGDLDVAIKTLTNGYGEALVWLYLGYVSLTDGAWAETIRDALTRIGTIRNEQSGAGMAVEQSASADDWLTNLDVLIETAIANTVAGSPGALDSDQLTDVVDEILQNNPHRAKTYFHKGYLDASLDKSVDPHFRGENRDRGLWYLAGAIRALEDRGDRQGIVTLFGQADLRDLGQEQNHRSALAAGPIFKALCLEGTIPAAVGFLNPRSVFHCGLFDWAFDFGTRMLRRQEIGSALKIFEMLQSAVDLLSTEQVLSLGTRAFDLKRRQAHCLRFQRHFGTAMKVLNRLLKEPTAPERSAMTVDVTLMSAGFRGLLDVVIPEHEPKRFAQRLEQLRPALEQAMEHGGDNSHAAYCLGVLALTSGRQADASRAAELLDTSVTNILRHANEYDLEGLLNRAKFYLGLARAEALDPNFAENAGALFQESVQAGFVPWGHLLKRYIDALSIVGQDQAVRAAETAVNKLGCQGRSKRGSSAHLVILPK